jgi:hypothetical protein
MAFMTVMTDSDLDLITGGQARARLAICANTLRAWERAGHIRSVNIAPEGWRRVLRYDRAEIESIARGERP